MTDTKEPMFFVSEVLKRKADTGVGGEKVDFVGELEEFRKSGKYRTVESYMSLFAPADNEKWIGESSHYLYHPDAAPIIREVSADARIVISIRHPVDRLHSEYSYYVRTGRVTGGFYDFVFGDLGTDISERAIFSSGNRLKKGFFGQLVEPWLREFGPEKVKIIEFSKFVNDPESTLSDLFEWLEVDSSIRPKIVHAERSGAPRFEAIGEHNLSKQ